MKSDAELQLTAQEASDRQLMRLQLNADVWNALHRYCHEGVRVTSRAWSSEKQAYQWAVSICSEAGYGPTLHAALDALRKAVRERLEEGLLGC
ncbi:MAG: hypothetical protein EPN91_00485 [Salinibacterium sp.]|nr:MAG: hypothetical protein EPN91_00485 [Salinibacterium sp.]